MKKIILSLVLLEATAVLALTLIPVKNTFTLKWEHTIDAHDDPTLAFIIYTSADLNKPQTNWSAYTNLHALDAWTGQTNGFTNINGVDFPLLVYALSNNPAAMKAQFFFATASNFYGESLPSNTVTSAPALMPIVPGSTVIER